jgi:hypothetical protein
MAYAYSEQKLLRKTDWPVCFAKTSPNGAYSCTGVLPLLESDNYKTEDWNTNITASKAPGFTKRTHPFCACKDAFYAK